MVDVTVRKRFRKNGETIYEYRFEIATVDGKRQWKTKCGFKTATEARKAGRMDLQTYENAGRVIAKDKMSVSDYFAYWISADCEIDLKPTTIMGYRKTIENLILPKLGSYRLKSLTREILQAFLLELYDAGYSQNTLVKVKAILSKSMNYAVDHHYIPYSPAVRLKSPKNRRPKVPTRTAPHYFIKQIYPHKNVKLLLNNAENRLRELMKYYYFYYNEYDFPFETEGGNAAYNGILNSLDKYKEMLEQYDKNGKLSVIFNILDNC